MPTPIPAAINMPICTPFIFKRNDALLSDDTTEGTGDRDLDFEVGGCLLKLRFHYFALRSPAL